MNKTIEERLKAIEAEEWRDVPDYEGLYQVSSFGRVRSLERVVESHKCNYLRKSRIRKLTKNKHGYMELSLSKDKNKQHFTMHRLVATAFIPNPDNNPQVNHKDGNKSNNYVKNLEWVSCSENTKHAIQIRLVDKEQLLHKSKLGAEAVSVCVQCKETCEVFPSITDASQSFKLSEQAIINSIKNGTTSHTGRGFTFIKLSKDEYEKLKCIQLDLNEVLKIRTAVLARIGQQGKAISVRCVETGEIFTNVSTAAKHFKMHVSAIFLAIKECRKAKGYTFEKVVNQ